MAVTKSKYSRPVFLVDGRRTPFLKARGKPGPFKHADLAIYAALLAAYVSVIFYLASKAARGESVRPAIRGSGEAQVALLQPGE